MNKYVELAMAYKATKERCQQDIDAAAAAFDNEKQRVIAAVKEGRVVIIEINDRIPDPAHEGSYYVNAYYVLFEFEGHRYQYTDVFGNEILKFVLPPA